MKLNNPEARNTMEQSQNIQGGNHQNISQSSGFGRVNQGSLGNNQQQGDVSRQLINDIRSMLSSGKSEMQIISAMTMKGWPPNYTSKMIQYVRQIDGMNNQNYMVSRLQSGRLRQSAPQSSPINQYQRTDHYARVQQAPSAGASAVHGKRNPAVLIIMLLLIIGVAFAVTFMITSSQENKQAKMSVNYKLTLTRAEFTLGNPIEYQSNIFIDGSRNANQLQIKNIIYNSNQDNAFNWAEEKSVEGRLMETIGKEIPDSLEDGQYYLFSEITLPDGSKKTARTDYFTLSTANNPDYNNPQETSGNYDPQQAEYEDTLPEDEQNIEDSNPITDGFEDTDDREQSGEINENGKNAETEYMDTRTPEMTDRDYALQEMQIKGEEDVEATNEINSRFSLALSFIKPPQTDNAKAASVCLEFIEAALRDSCMTQLAQSGNNYAFCNEIDDLFSRDYCYLNYVINTRDYEKCSFIESPESKHSCQALNSARSK